MKTSSNKSVFNLKEATAYLGMSVPTLVRLLGSGAIPYRRVGQRWLITRSALDDWLNKKNCGRRDQHG